MIILLEELAMQLFLWFLQLIDGIMELFNSLSGIDDVLYAGEEVNIVESAVRNPTVQSVFWCVLVAAVGLACIFTIVAVIKNMVTSQKSLSSILGKFFLAILGTMAMLLVVLLGIMIANELLRLLADIFKLNTNVKLSSTIFEACAGEWLNGFSIKDFDASTTTVRDLFGNYDTAMWVWPTSWQMNGMIDPSGFYYAPAIFAIVILVFNLLKAMLAMARRLFEIVYCYFCMPVAMSTLPLDDGRFRNWTVAFLSKILLAFGCVLSVNIFSLLMPFVTNLTIPGAGSFENAILKLALIVGGAEVIPAGQALFVRIFSSGEYRPDEGRHIDSLRRRINTAGINMLLGTTGAGVYAAKWAGKAISGRRRRSSGASEASSGEDPDDGAYREGYIDPEAHVPPDDPFGDDPSVTRMDVPDTYPVGPDGEPRDYYVTPDGHTYSGPYSGEDEVSSSGSASASGAGSGAGSSGSGGVNGGGAGSSAGSSAGGGASGSHAPEDGTGGSAGWDAGGSGGDA